MLATGRCRCLATFSLLVSTPASGPGAANDVPGADVDDLLQEVLLILVRKLAEFQRQADWQLSQLAAHDWRPTSG